MPADLPEIARVGYDSVTCNRPDSENSGPYSQEVMAAAAIQVGLTMVYLPVVSGQRELVCCHTRKP